MVLLPVPPFRLTVPVEDVASIQLFLDPPIIVVEAVPAINELLPVLDAAVRVFCLEVPPLLPVPLRLPPPIRLRPSLPSLSVVVSLEVTQLPF
jgi:hypothetical protein